MEIGTFWVLEMAADIINAKIVVSVLFQCFLDAIHNSRCFVYRQLLTNCRPMNSNINRPRHRRHQLIQSYVLILHCTPTKLFIVLDADAVTFAVGQVQMVLRIKFLLLLVR